MPKRNKKVIKLRHYRDKLLARITTLEQQLRTNHEMFRQIRKALSQEEGATLRAYAIATDGLDETLNTDTEDYVSLEFISKNDAVAELTLVYRMLAVERNYTYEMGRALNTQDLLRMAALAADHTAEQIAHDKMLSTWSKDHGFTKSLRDECEI